MTYNNLFDNFSLVRWEPSVDLALGLICIIITSLQESALSTLPVLWNISSVYYSIAFAVLLAWLPHKLSYLNYYYVSQHFICCVYSFQLSQSQRLVIAGKSLYHMLGCLAAQWLENATLSVCHIVLTNNLSEQYSQQWSRGRCDFYTCISIVIYISR